MKEPILEPLLRYLRIRRILPYLKHIHECSLLDIGCGWKANFLRDAEPYIASGIGIDFKAPVFDNGKIKTLCATLDKKLPFEDKMFDVVSMLAVLEHLQFPNAVVDEVYRVLKPGGIFIGTVPSNMAKPVLEFLAYRLGIINSDEIRDHKNYFNKKLLLHFFNRQGSSL